MSQNKHQGVARREALLAEIKARPHRFRYSSAHHFRGDRDLRELEKAGKIERYRSVIWARPGDRRCGHVRNKSHDVASLALTAFRAVETPPAPAGRRPHSRQQTRPASNHCSHR